MNSLQNPLNANYPQDVTQKPGENAVFIVYALKDLPDTIDKVKDVCANFSALIRSMRNRYPDMQFSCTIGFGADAWKRFFPEQGNPKELQPFEEIKGVKLTAVSTPGDLLFHIRCKQMGLCFEFASIIDQKLRGVVESIDETHGFRYRDGKASLWAEVMCLCKNTFMIWWHGMRFQWKSKRKSSVAVNSTMLSYQMKKNRRTLITP